MTITRDWAQWKKKSDKISWEIAIQMSCICQCQEKNMKEKWISLQLLNISHELWFCPIKVFRQTPLISCQVLIVTAHRSFLSVHTWCRFISPIDFVNTALSFWGLSTLRILCVEVKTFHSNVPAILYCALLVLLWVTLRDLYEMWPNKKKKNSVFVTADKYVKKK